jgi:hypothetical protein
MLYICVCRDVLCCAVLCRFDEAVSQYHRALSLQPAFSFCADMLTQALSDMCAFPACAAPPLSSGFPSRRGEEKEGGSRSSDGVLGVFQQPHVVDALFLPPQPAQTSSAQKQGQAGARGELWSLQSGAEESLVFSRQEQSLLSQFSAVPEQACGRGGLGLGVSMSGLDESSRFASPGSLLAGAGAAGGLCLDASFQSFQSSRSRLSSGGGDGDGEGGGSVMSWDEQDQGGHHEETDESGSVQSYSRVAGRLSMNSAASDEL